MATTKISKAEREYNAIRNNPTLTARQRIEAALAFDADGRPGASNVRDAQAQLSNQKREAIKRAQAVRRFDGSRFAHWVKYPDTVPEISEYLNARAFRVKRRERALAAQGDHWLREISHTLFEIRDAKLGFPAKCFGFNEHQTPATEIDLFALPMGDSGTRFARVNGWLARTSEQEDLNWSTYSKAWHRAHGPKRTIHSRKVEIRRLSADGQVEVRDVRLDGWRGHWLLNSLVEAGVIVAPKVPAKLRSVQLHAAYDVREVRRAASAVFYARTLAGQHIDYCVVWHGLAFHAATLRACLKGLRVKLAEAERRQNATIDFKFCRELGFCETGIREFATEFNLDLKGRYTAEEIADRIKGKLPAAAPFAAELKRLATAVGYRIPASLEVANA